MPQISESISFRCDLEIEDGTKLSHLDMVLLVKTGMRRDNWSLEHAKSVGWRDRNAVNVNSPLCNRLVQLMLPRTI